MEEENQEVVASLFGQDKCKNDCKLSVYQQAGVELCQAQNKLLLFI
jgi:hypothetical protein